MPAAQLVMHAMDDSGWKERDAVFEMLHNF